MKQATWTTIAVALLLLLAAAFPQDQQLNRKAQRQHKQMMKTMKDSSLVSMMMDSIASNRGLCMTMMQKMMHHAKADSVAMMQMGKMMTEDQGMHATLTKLMDAQKQDRHGTAQEILIRFNPGVMQAQVNALESEVGLHQIKAIPQLDMRVFRITSSKTANEVIALCEKKSFVKYAEPNDQYKALKNN